MGIVVIVCFPRGMYEPPDRWRSTVRKAGLARRQKRSRPRRFYSAAQMDPNYIYRTGSSPTQSVWSYVGRTEYLTGRIPQARQALERALSSNQPEDITRLYLGLTLAREGDRQRGLKEIES